jgi:hypothetical protein
MTDPAKTEVELPEMPRTYVVHWADSQQELHYHTAEQLTEFATAAVLQERERLKIERDAIARTLQSWLDWHARDSGAEPSDDQHIMTVPVWPSRGVLKNWIKVIRGEWGPEDHAAWIRAQKEPI